MSESTGLRRSINASAESKFEGEFFFKKYIHSHYREAEWPEERLLVMGKI